MQDKQMVNDSHAELPGRKRDRLFSLSSASPFRYQVYGLQVQSDIELPELDPPDCLPVVEPDIEVCSATLPRKIVERRFRYGLLDVEKDRVLVQYSDRFCYQVLRGRQIVLDHRMVLGADSDEMAELRAHLLGTAFGIALHQRDTVPLHISAVSAPSGVWAFTGTSGAGKSTLATWLSRSRGWRLLTDDVGAISRTPDYPSLAVGPRRAKLWKDALEHFGVDTHDLYQDLNRQDKFHIRLGRDPKTSSLPRLRALVELAEARTGTESSVERLHGSEAFKV